MFNKFILCSQVKAVAFLFKVMLLLRAPTLGKSALAKTKKWKKMKAFIVQLINWFSLPLTFIFECCHSVHWAVASHQTTVSPPTALSHFLGWLSLLSTEDAHFLFAAITNTGTLSTSTGHCERVCIQVLKASGKWSSFVLVPVTQCT